MFDHEGDIKSRQNMVIKNVKNQFIDMTKMPILSRNFKN